MELQILEQIELHKNPISNIVNLLDTYTKPKDRITICKILYQVIKGDFDPDHVDFFTDFVTNFRFKYWDVLFKSLRLDKSIKMADQYLLVFTLLYNLNSDNKYWNGAEILKTCNLPFRLFTKKFTNGQAYENDPSNPLSWIKLNNTLIKKEYIDYISDAILVIYKKQNIKNKKKLIMHFYNLININKYYNSSDPDQIITKRCSQFTFITFIYKVILQVVYKLDLFSHDIENTITNINTKSRNTYNIYDSDTHETMWLMTVYYGYNVIYNPQFKMYSMFYESFGFPMKYKDSIKNIMFDKDYHKTVNYFIEQYIDHKLKINDDILDTYTNSIYLNLKYESYPYTEYTDKQKQNILDIFDTSNPYIKYNIISIINHLKIKNNQTLEIYLKYLIQVNIFNIIEPQSAHVHYREVLTHINKFLDKQTKYEIEKEILVKAIHKMCSKSIETLDSILQITTKYSTELQNSKEKEYSFKRYYRECYIDYISAVFKTLLLTVKTVDNILFDLIDISTLEMVLITPITTLIITVLETFSSGRNPIYDVFEMNKEVQLLFVDVFELVATVRKNDNFTKEIVKSLTILKEMLYTVKLEDDLKQELSVYFKDIENIQNTPVVDLPEEFMDPILYIPITEPVMLPNVNDMIFDKNSIIGQLYYNNNNPYTNEPLSIDKFLEYNTKPDVIEKINKFKEKLINFKK